MAKKKYYGVKKGHQTGIFDNWEDCSAQIHGFKGAMYKGFETLEEANAYMEKQEAKQSERHTSAEDVFLKLKEGEMLTYVDGSNLPDASCFSWGVVGFFKKDGGEKKFSISGKSVNPRFIQYRNVAGELFAAVNAVKCALKLGAKKVYIYHDYSGIRHWALGEWKVKNDLSQSYARYMETALGMIEVEFVKVEGHTGDIFNEEVDVLVKTELGINKKGENKNG